MIRLLNVKVYNKMKFVDIPLHSIEKFNSMLFQLDHSQLKLCTLQLRIIVLSILLSNKDAKIQNQFNSLKLCNIVVPNFGNILVYNGTGTDELSTNNLLLALTILTDNLMLNKILFKFLLLSIFSSSLLSY